METVEREEPDDGFAFTFEEAVDIAHRAADSLDSPLLRAIEIGKRVRVRARGISDAPAPMLPREGFDWWNEVLKWRTRNNYDAVVLFTGAVGTGKCWQRGSKVLMYSGGSKAVEDVKVGDLLMGPDSNPRTVLRLWRGRSEMRRVVPTRGMAPFVVTPEHKLVLLKGNEIKEIEVDRLPKRHDYKLFGVGIDFPIGSSLPLDPYLLGLILGDGTLAKSCRQKPESYHRRCRDSCLLPRVG